jgi:hypothetical protein
MTLSDTAVRAAKPSERPRKLSDGGGLFVLITPKPGGSKLWRLAYRFAGKQKTLALGTYPAVSLSEARRSREAAKKLLANGVDPSIQRKIDRQLANSTVENTFRTVAEEVIAKLEREGRAHVTIAKKRSSRLRLSCFWRPISKRNNSQRFAGLAARDRETRDL